MEGSDSGTSETLTAAAPDTAQRPDPEETPPIARAASERELGLWLLALRSFLDLRNHPLAEVERAELLNRDFTHETRIAQQTLRRCLRLVLTLPPDAGAAGRNEPLPLKAEHARAGVADRDGAMQQGQPVALIELLGDAHGLCEALLAAPRVSFHAWGSFGRLLARSLEQSDAAHSLMQAELAQTLLERKPELYTLTERLTPDTLCADMQAIFGRLALLLDELRFVEEALRRDAPLKQHMPLFTLAHAEARMLIELIERRALCADELSEAVRNVLDSTGYAVSMELSKVFARELVGLAALRDPVAIYTRMENAHGLLRDCFQQTAVALAQAFDPTFDGARLFHTFRTRLEQSLVLRRDLWTLLNLVRRAEQEDDQRQFAPVLARLGAFQAGSMSYLMFKDWEAFERFVQDLREAADVLERGAVLHRFGTFIEALFSQVSLRAVLADHPFDAHAVADE